MDVSRGLNNKVVVITGGCGDIGGATALKLAELGAKVVLFDILDSEAGRARMNQLHAASAHRSSQDERIAGRHCQCLPGIRANRCRDRKCRRRAWRQSPGFAGFRLGERLADQPDWLHSTRTGGDPPYDCSRTRPKNQDPGEGLVH